MIWSLRSRINPLNGALYRISVLVIIWKGLSKSGVRIVIKGRASRMKVLHAKRRDKFLV